MEWQDEEQRQEPEPLASLPQGRALRLDSPEPLASLPQGRALRLDSPEPLASLPQEQALRLDSPEPLASLPQEQALRLGQPQVRLSRHLHPHQLRQPQPPWLFLPQPFAQPHALPQLAFLPAA